MRKHVTNCDFDHFEIMKFLFELEYDKRFPGIFDHKLSDWQEKFMIRKAEAISYAHAAIGQTEKAEMGRLG